jgi:hypothetical protein
MQLLQISYGTFNAWSALKMLAPVAHMLNKNPR